MYIDLNDKLTIFMWMFYGGLLTKEQMLWSIFEVHTMVNRPNQANDKKYDFISFFYWILSFKLTQCKQLLKIILKHQQMVDKGQLRIHMGFKTAQR